MPSQIYLKQLEKTLSNWKTYGAVSTPEKIVNLMIKLADLPRQQNLDILEPACGLCNFLFAVYGQFPKNNFCGIEYNKKIYAEVKKIFNNVPFNLRQLDFLLWDTNKKFDLIIGNPPYGIIGNESHYPIHILKQKKQEYKNIFHTWYGKYNIYGAFIEKSVNLLKTNGTLVFIIPATWMILDDFKKLRKFLSLQGKTKVYYLGNKIFKNVSVSVCILIFEKDQKGVELFYKDTDNFIQTANLKTWNGQILKFDNAATKQLEQNKILLQEVFDIKISARSPEVRRFNKVLTKPAKNALPFMKGKNIKKGYIERKNYAGFWLEEKEVANLKSFYSITPRITVGHTKGGVIFAALENELYPYIGDVYHLLPRIKLEKSKLSKIVNWLNSDNLNKYMFTLYKNITPHTTATQLKCLPLKINTPKTTLF